MYMLVLTNQKLFPPLPNLEKTIILFKNTKTKFIVFRERKKIKEKYFIINLINYLFENKQIKKWEKVNFLSS